MPATGAPAVAVSPAKTVNAGNVANTVLGAQQAKEANEANEAQKKARWSAAPVPPQGEKPGDARSYFYLEGEPGTVLKDTVALTNESARARTFRLRGADAYNARGGGFAVRGKGRSEGAGKWLALAEDSVRVPPRTRAEVPFTVTVPAGAVPGDHPAVVVVSDGDRESGVRVHLRVSGPTLAALSVEKVAVRDKDEGASIAYTLVNRGNTALRPRLAVSADGVFGQLLHRDARPLPVELLPGQRVTLHEPWQKAPGLELADVRLRVTAEGGARDEATASYTAVPWGGIGVGLVVLALAAGGACWYVRKRSPAARARATAREDGGDGEDGEDGDASADGAAPTDGESDGTAADGEPDGGGGGDQDSGGSRELTGAAK